MPTVNKNRIATKTCPVCGDARPLDWFGPELKLIDHKKDGSVRKAVRYRKYFACWRCRELKRNTLLAFPPFDEVAE